MSQNDGEFTPLAPNIADAVWHDDDDALATGAAFPETWEPPEMGVATPLSQKAPCGRHIAAGCRAQGL